MWGPGEETGKGHAAWMHGQPCLLAGSDQRGKTGPRLLMVLFTGMAVGPGCIPEGFRKAHHYRPCWSCPEFLCRTGGLSRQEGGSFVTGRG